MRIFCQEEKYRISIIFDIEVQIDPMHKHLLLKFINTLEGLAHFILILIATLIRDSAKKIFDQKNFRPNFITTFND